MAGWFSRSGYRAGLFVLLLFLFGSFGAVAYAAKKEAEASHGPAVHTEEGAHGHDTHGHDAHGHDDDHGKSSGGLPQFDPSSYSGQVFWILITFAVLYLFFSRKALPEIEGVLETRQEHIQRDIDLAETLQADAEQARETYEADLENARSESVRIMNEAGEAVKKMTEERVRDFHTRAEQDIRDLETALQDSRRAAMEEMGDIAAEAACTAAEKVAGIKTDAKQAQASVQAMTAAVLNEEQEAA